MDLLGSYTLWPHMGEEWVRPRAGQDTVAACRESNIDSTVVYPVAFSLYWAIRVNLTARSVATALCKQGASSNADKHVTLTSDDIMREKMFLQGSGNDLVPNSVKTGRPTATAFL